MAHYKIITIVKFFEHNNFCLSYSITIIEKIIFMLSLTKKIFSHLTKAKTITNWINSVKWFTVLLTQFLLTH